MHGSSNPLSSILHIRRPWAGGEKVYVCATLGELNGGGLTRRAGSRERSKLYNMAKFRGDHESADKLISLCISDRVIDRIIDDVDPQIAPARSRLPFG
jgi:hypothetical protein